ncbi:MAG TPA: cyclic nucleotide-binding domain-containing protein [Gaiellaceae bacterium]|nr:cyclic nucleotide-binding domain-containing protein [Gaiellaceae bacterium]
MTSSSDGASLRLLTTLPLFAGVADDELELFTRVTRTVDVPQGALLWREGDEADGLHVIASGKIKVETRLPGQRTLEIATLGHGGVLGEMPLLGGGQRWATATALEDSSLLFLGRVEFGGLVSGASPGALTVRRRLLAIVCDRLRQRHVALADWLGGARSSTAEPPAAPQRPADGAPAPREDYVLRLPFFRSLDRAAAADVLQRASFLEAPAFCDLVGEAAPASGCWITINGAVEELIRRGDEVIRVSLAGPGHAFGYLGLIDGLPSSVAAATRERSLLLYLPPDEFEALFDPAVLAATAFRDAIQRDLVRALRAAARPQARLAAAR